VKGVKGCAARSARGVRVCVCAAHVPQGGWEGGLCQTTYSHPSPSNPVCGQPSPSTHQSTLPTAYCPSTHPPTQPADLTQGQPRQSHVSTKPIIGLGSVTPPVRKITPNFLLSHYSHSSPLLSPSPNPETVEQTTNSLRCNRRLTLRLPSAHHLLPQLM
jgi:hypothetical protein